MPIVTLKQRSRPSYTQGFARSAAESAYPNLWRGLVGAWLPSLGPTGATLRDVSGRGNHGTLTSMDPATDWVMTEKGWAVNFPDATDYVAIGNPVSLQMPTGGLSVFAWINTPTSENGQGIVNKGAIFASGLNYGLGILSNNLYWQSRTASAGIWTFGTSFTTTNAWAFVGGTWDGTASAGGARIWVNGQQKNQATPSATTIETGADLRFGLGTLGTFDFEGMMGPVFIYNRALSPNEIQQLYIDPLAPARLRRWVPVGTAAAPPSFAGSNLVLGGGVI